MPSIRHPGAIAAANNLRRLRVAAGLNQTQVADALGCTFQQVQKLEAGVNRLTVDAMVLLTGVLGRSVADLVEGVAEGRAPAPRAERDRICIEHAKLFEVLPPESRAAVHAVAKSLAGMHERRAA